MWIFSEQGFFSVVEDWEDRDCVYVRARWKKDLENILSIEGAPARCLAVISTPERDYPFRVHMTKSEWSRVASVMAGGIGYGNFKGRISVIDPDRERLYMRVWDIMRKGSEVLK